MAALEDNSKATYRIRTHQPSDLSVILDRHVTQYASEFGWTPAILQTVTEEITTDILNTYDATHERVFIAEDINNNDPNTTTSATPGKFLGCVALLSHRDDIQDDTAPTTTARLRLLLVDPATRGTGLGTRLVEECVGFARAAGYARIMLTTYDVLEGARRLYARAGFRVVRADEEGEEHWGVRLVQEVWELML